MSKTSKLLASTLAVLLLILFGSWLLRSSHKAVPPATSLNELAAAAAENGEMSKQDYLNYSRIDATVEKTGTISGEDLDWMLTLLKTPVNSSNQFAPEIRRSDVTISLHHIKNFTPSQEDKVYHAVSELLSSSNRLDKIGAVAVMKTIKDKRALPDLTRLLSDNDPTVQTQAKKAIQAINS